MTDVSYTWAFVCSDVIARAMTYSYVMNPTWFVQNVGYAANELRCKDSLPHHCLPEPDQVSDDQGREAAREAGARALPWRASFPWRRASLT